MGNLFSLRLLSWAIAAAILLLLIPGIFFAFNIPLNLSPFKDRIEAWVANRLDMEVAISGPLRLIPGFNTSIEVQGLALRPLQTHPNQEAARIDYLQTSVAIKPLLQHELRVPEITLQGIYLRPGGWGSGAGGPDPEKNISGGEDAHRDPSGKEQPPWQIRVDKLEIHDATIDFSSGKNSNILEVSQAVGAISPMHGSALSLRGAYRDLPWVLELQGSDLSQLMATGGFHGSLDLSLPGTGISARAKLSRQAGALDLALTLKAADVDLRHLAGSIPAGQAAACRLDKFMLTASATGRGFHDLLENLQARLELSQAELSLGTSFAGGPNRVAVDSALLELPSGGRLSGSMRGRILDEAYEMTLQGPGTADIMAGTQWPLSLSFDGVGARLHLQGDISPWEENAGGNFSLGVSGECIGDLAAFSGLAPSADLPYLLQANLLWRKHSRRFAIQQLKLGNSSLRGFVDQAVSPDGDRLTALSISADLIDLVQLHTAFYLADAAEARTAGTDPRALEEPAPILDMVVFPEDMHLPPLELNVNVRRIHASRLDYDQCYLKARLRNDGTIQSSFQFKLQEASFAGEVFMEMAQQPPIVGLQVSADRFNLGTLLQALDLAHATDTRAERFDIRLASTGRTLDELIRHRELDINMHDNRWEFNAGGTGDPWIVELKRVAYTDHPDEPFKISAGGLIRDTPLTMELAIQKKASRDTGENGLPYTLAVQGSDMQVSLTGQLHFPAVLRGREHRFAISGQSFQTLQQLFRTDFPELAPFRAGGIVRLADQSFSLKDATLSLGESRLSGTLEYITTGVRPKLLLRLKADRFRLEDLGWRPPDSPLYASGADAVVNDAKEGELRHILGRFFDPAVQHPYDMDINLEAEQVIAGGERLGGGKLRVARNPGYLELAPVILKVPGGELAASLTMMAVEQGVAGQMQLQLRNLDYGPLLQALSSRSKGGPEDGKGIISLMVDLKSRAAVMEEFMANSSGRLAVSLQPENLKSGALDLWAVNLLGALLPVINPANASQINCIVADLALDNGVMTENSIIIDTSRIRVRGKARLDFRDETIRMKLTPRPKRPQFLSLATPIEVKGNFADFKVGLAPGSLIGTVIRFLTAKIIVPIQWIVLNKLPADGRDVCTGLEPFPVQ